MTLLAALAIGACCALVAAHAVGQPVELRRWPRPTRNGPTAQWWLHQAGVRVTPRQFVLGSVAVGIAAFAVTFFLTGAALVAVVPACAAASIPRAYFGRRRLARLRELQAAWPDGLRDVVASVAAGRSLSHALTTLAETGPAALRDAFARFPLLARMLGTVPALEVVKSELADPTSDRVIEVLILAHERGGAIVRQILEDLVVATTKDLKVLDEIESEGLEMKINARAVLVMPWLVLVALTLRAGPFRSFYQSSAGVLVVLVAAVLSAVGSWWISRLGRAHQEQRVFAGRHPLGTSA
jgi:tight adherence protein B